MGVIFEVSEREFGGFGIGMVKSVVRGTLREV